MNFFVPLKSGCFHSIISIFRVHLNVQPFKQTFEDDTFGVSGIFSIAGRTFMPLARRAILCVAAADLPRDFDGACGVRAVHGSRFHLAHPHAHDLCARDKRRPSLLRRRPRRLSRRAPYGRHRPSRALYRMAKNPARRTKIDRMIPRKKSVPRDALFA